MRTVILLCVSCFIFSCQPKATKTNTGTTTTPTSEVKPVPSENKLIGTSWKLTGITFHEKDEFIDRPPKEKGLTVRFIDATKLSVRLSRNNCTANYTLDGDKITITLGGCTKMCCDTEFAQGFWAVLGTAQSVYHREKYLDIKGTEKILKMKQVEIMDK